MPIVYVAGKLKIDVELPKDEDFCYGEWTDEKLAKQRKEYEQPNIGLWFEFPQPEDSIESFPISVGETDLYEGKLSTTRNGRKFTFEFEGKAKVNIHKLVKAKLDSGETPVLSSVSINGQGYSIEPRKTELVIQSKKV